jgi:ABC-type protease/lipase transport system fused ATPase/permease subunit
VIVVSHRTSALAALNMAIVLYEGRAIAFGPREDVFARLSRGAVVPAFAAAPTTNERSRVIGGVRA